MNLYIMRHGETDWNTVRKIQGRTDIPLNQNGIDMAEETSKNVFAEGIVFDAIYSSPLIRALKTAEIMGKYSDCSVVTDQRLTEFNFGEGEGLTLSQMEQDPKYANIINWFKNPVLYKSELGSESFESIFGRLTDFLNEVILPLEKKCNNVLISCHGGVCRAMLTIIEQKGIEDFSNSKIPNCGINCFELKDGRFYLKYKAKKFYKEESGSLSDYDLSKK